MKIILWIAVLLIITTVPGCNGEEEHKQNINIEETNTFVGTVCKIKELEEYGDLQHPEAIIMEISEYDDMYKKSEYVVYFTGYEGCETKQNKENINIGDKLQVEYVGEIYEKEDISEITDKQGKYFYADKVISVKEVKSFTGVLRSIDNYKRYGELKNLALNIVELSEDDELYGECKYIMYFTGYEGCKTKYIGHGRVDEKIVAEYTGEPYINKELLSNIQSSNEKWWMIDNIIMEKGICD